MIHIHELFEQDFPMSSKHWTLQIKWNKTESNYARAFGNNAKRGNGDTDATQFLRKCENFVKLFERK